MSLDNLRQRMKHILVVVEKHYVDAQAEEFDRQLQALTSEALCRRFALITPDHHLPDDFEAQCTLIDLDIEARMTPGLRAAEQRFQQKYAAQLAGCRDELVRRLEAMHEAVSEEVV